MASTAGTTVRGRVRSVTPTVALSVGTTRSTDIDDRKRAEEGLAKAFRRNCRQIRQLNFEPSSMQYLSSSSAFRGRRKNSSTQIRRYSTTPA